MKKLTILLFLFAAIISNGQETTLSKKDVKNFTNEFIAVLQSGDLESSIDYFYPYYVEDQLIKMLSGNTSQFITEFLAGNMRTKSGEEVFIVPVMADIVAIKVKKTQLDIVQGSGIAEVEIKLNTGAKYKTSLMLVVGADKKLYFIGPVG
jgi:hypothetical protein